MNDFDAVIIGAGAVGLACAYALTRRGSNVVVIEKADRIGAGISSRNSEVIHAGLHYATGSLKARLCVQGRRALYEFLPAHNVPFQKCGKLIVATEASEEPALAALARQADINGVEGVTMLSGDDARAIEPELRASAALESRESGVMDAHGYMLALEGEIGAHGGAIALNAPFEGAAPIADGYSVRVGGEAAMTITTHALIVAAGLGAQACARTIENFPACDWLPRWVSGINGKSHRPSR
jgi:L-2-hydroxyglutarate oxidase LhgO